MKLISKHTRVHVSVLMAELAKKKVVPRGKKVVTKKMLDEVDSLLPAVDGGAVPDPMKLSQFRFGLDEKLDYLHKLDKEILTLTDDEEEVMHDIEEADKFMQEIYNKFVTIDSCLAAVPASNEPASSTSYKKFSYLQTLLTKEAKDTKAGLALSAANCSEAIALLELRFGNKERIISKHMDTLFALKSVSWQGNTMALRALYDKVQAHLRALKALVVSPEAYTSLLPSVLMRKLPSELELTSFELCFNISRHVSDDTWNLDNLMNVLGDELKARERAAPEVKKSGFDICHSHEFLEVTSKDDTLNDQFKLEVSFTGEHYEVALPWRDTALRLPDNYKPYLRRLNASLRRLRQQPELLREYSKAISEMVDKRIMERVVDPDTLSGERLRVVYDGSAKKVAEHDCDALHFLWVSDANEYPPSIEVLRFARVIFGVACSPFLLNATIKYHLESYHKSNSDDVAKLAQSMYVDNVISGMDNERDALNQFLAFTIYFLRRKLYDKVELGMYKIYSSNDIHNPSGYAHKIMNIIFGVYLINHSKPRSIYYIDTDELVLNLSEIVCDGNERECLTKRRMVSVVSRIFDPIGIASPVTVQAKLLLQELHNANIEWDGVIGGELYNRCKVLSVLHESEPIRVPRWYKRDFYENSNLLGALLLSRLIHIVEKALMTDIKLLSTICCSDSEVVLYWIREKNQDWKPFAQNRVWEIRYLLPAACWRHCPGIFERLIQSVKQCLKKTIGRAKLTREELLTMENQLKDSKLAFTGVYDNIILTKTIQNSSNRFQMLFLSGTSNMDITDVTCGTSVKSETLSETLLTGGGGAETYITLSARRASSDKGVSDLAEASIILTLLGSLRKKSSFRKDGTSQRTVPAVALFYEVVGKAEIETDLVADNIDGTNDDITPCSPSGSPSTSIPNTSSDTPSPSVSKSLRTPPVTKS
uniref:Uncharacterized protein n=2 Tax=Amphimedon queenslandica TaxID=400682 RepID=A0A1X7UDE7_AMPQE